MGNDLKTSVIVDLKGDLERQAKRNEQAVSRFSRNSSRNLNGLGRSVKTVNKTFGSMGKKLAGIATAAAAIRKIGQVMEFDARLTQLRTDGRISEQDVALLKKKIFEVANARDIRLDPDKIMAAFTQIIASTGDKEFAMENLRNIGLTIRASNADGTDVGAVFSNLYDGNIRTSEKVLSAINTMVEQGKSGAFTFKDVASYGGKLFAPYLSLGATGEQAFKDMNAIVQISIKAAGSSAEAVEATKMLLADLIKPEVIKKLNASGINVFKEDGKIVDSPKLILDIYEKANRDISRLSTLFGEGSIKVFQGLGLPGNVEKLRWFANMQSSGGELADSATINAGTGKAFKQSASNYIIEAADYTFSKAIKDFVVVIEDLQNKDALTNAKTFGSALAKEAGWWADLIASPFTGNDKGLKTEKPEAKVILEIEAKNVTVKTKEIKSQGIELEVNSGKTMVSP